LKYISALLLFGSNGIVASYIPLNSYEIVFLRTLLGSLFLLAVFVMTRGKYSGRGRHSFWEALPLEKVSGESRFSPYLL
jgi:hypothetical protein